MEMKDCVDSSPINNTSNSPTQEQTSKMVATESKPVTWTNEKHCLFLKSMESVFINQLYKSKDAFGSHSRKNCTTTTTNHSSSAQFKIFRASCLSKRENHGVDSMEESKAPPANPWIQHCRNSQISKTRKVQASRTKAFSAATRNQNPESEFKHVHQDSIGSNTEMMDQNFSDGSFEDKRACRAQGCMYRAGSSSDVNSSTDQVVPIYNHVPVDNVTEDNQVNTRY